MRYLFPGKSLTGRTLTLKKGDDALTAIIVICVIILLFAFILNAKIRAEIKYIGGIADFKVKYLCFTLFPLKERKKKPEKRKDKKKKNAAKHDTGNESPPQGNEESTNQEDTGSAEISEEETDTEVKKEKKKLSDKLDELTDIIEKVKIIWNFSQKGLKRLFKNIHIDGLVIDFTIAGEDAYKTALNYGRISAATYNAITFIRVLFPISVKSVDIACDFDGRKSVYDCEAKITITPGTILSAASIVLFGLLRNYRRLTGKTKNQPDPQKAVTV